MPRFTNFLKKFTIHFCKCFYLVTCFVRVTVSLLCRSQGRTISSPSTNKRGINWNKYLWYSNETDWTKPLHSNETVTLMKHATIYKNMRKWLVDFLRKFSSRGIKMLEWTQFASSNQSMYFNFARCWGPLDRGRFSVHSPFINKSMIRQQSVVQW